MLKEQLLQTLYDVVITSESFDKIKLFGIGSKIKSKREQDKKLVIQQEQDDFITQSIADLSGSEKLCASILIRNQLNSISMQQGYTTKTDDLMRSIGVITAKKLLAVGGIVGIQPMNGPVGPVYQIAYTLDETNDDKIRFMRLEVKSGTVEASSHILHANWSIEASYDLVYGLDIRNELIQAITTEIVEEVISEIVSDLQKLAAYHDIPLVTKLSELTQHSVKAVCNLNMASNDIARKTRRGRGNYIICNPDSLNNLCMYTKNANLTFIFSDVETKNPGLQTFHLAGSIVGTEEHKQYDVYVSNTIPTHDDKDSFLIGYKGESGELDTGYVFAPYVPVALCGVVVDALTFVPQVKLMTRYGKYGQCEPSQCKPIEQKSLADSTQYYRMVEIEYPEI
jgi:hypothetical protein